MLNLTSELNSNLASHAIIKGAMRYNAYGQFSHFLLNKVFSGTQKL